MRSETTAFYTNVRKWGKKLLVRGVNEYGKRFVERVPYKPSLFIPSKKTESEFHDIYGAPLDRVRFDSMAEAKEFVERYKGVTGFQIAGNTDYVYCYIADQYTSKHLKHDFTKIRLVTLDIETESEAGFPTVALAQERINVISLRYRDKVYLFGMGEFKQSEDEPVDYFDCANEKHLLEEFLAVWAKIGPDIVTGWNILCFDMPYLYKRLKMILGEEEARKLSPWGIVFEQKKKVREREEEVIDIYGTSQLDYLQLYLKFTYKNRENYKLATIAFIELGQTKLDHSEFDSFADFYKENYQKFLEYNLIDSELVVRLEQKLRLIELVVGMAYQAGVNYQDVFSPVRTWETFIFGHLVKHKFVVPFKQEHDKDEQYEGAYVKEPVTGLHRWVVGFDLNSLYPSIMRQWNISPEKLVRGKMATVDVKTLLRRKYKTDALSRNKQTLAANGAFFDAEALGFIPILLAGIYEQRVVARKSLLTASQKLEYVNAEIERRGAGKKKTAETDQTPEYAR